MSWEAVTWANNQRLKKSYEQIVLLVLANCADPNGEAFIKWPGRDHWWIYLSQRTRLPKSSLFRHLNTLVALGLGTRTSQVLSDGSKRPTFKLDLTATFDIDRPEDHARYQAAFAKASTENQSPVGTEHDDDHDSDENDNDISNSQDCETTIASQSPVETGAAMPQSPVGTHPVPVLRLHKDSLPYSKDSPLPPSGGVHAPDQLWEEFVRSWGEPIAKMGLARQAWERIETTKRPEVVASAKGLWAYRRTQTKPPTPQSAQSFLRDVAGWTQWLRYVPDAGGLAPGIANLFPVSSPEGRAISALYDIAGKLDFLRSVMLRGGTISYALPITSKLLALADVGPKDDWPVLATIEQAASWDNFLRDAVTVQVRRHLRVGDHAPKLWPPLKDGTWSKTGPPDVLMSEDDFANLK